MSDSVQAYNALIAFFGREQVMTTGQVWQQTVRHYTGVLVDQPGLNEKGEDPLLFTRTESWRLRYPKFVRTKLLKLLLAIPASKKSVMLLLDALDDRTTREPRESIFRVCFPPLRRGAAFPTIGGGLAKVLHDMLAGPEHVSTSCMSRRRPLGVLNPGAKCAILMEWFTRVLGSYPDCALYDIAKLDYVRSTTFVPLCDALLEMLDPNALHTTDRKFRSHFYRTLQEVSWCPSPVPTPQEMAFCILHGFTLSYNDFDGSDGIAIDYCNRIVAYRDGAFLPHLWRELRSWSNRYRRSREGKPTGENLPRLASNLLLSRALDHLIHSGQQLAPGVPSLQEWEEFVTNFWVSQLLQRKDMTPAYPNVRCGVDAICITLSRLAHFVFASEVLYTDTVLRSLVKLYDESPPFRNSVITLWNGMGSLLDTGRLQKLRFMRAPAKLETVLIDEPNEGEIFDGFPFYNRTFAAAACLCKMIGHVEDHPFLNTTGRKIIPVLLDVARYCFDRYRNEKQWRRKPFQGVIVTPREAMETMNALANSFDNRLRLVESGGVHVVAEMLSAQLQAHEKVLKTYSKVQNGFAWQLSPIREDDARYALSVLLRLASAPQLNCLEDLERGFESDVNIVDVLQKLSQALPPSLGRDAQFCLRRLQVQAAAATNTELGPTPALDDEVDGQLKHKVFISYTWSSSRVGIGREAAANVKQNMFYGTQKLAVFLQEHLKKEYEVDCFLDLKDMATTPRPTILTKMEAGIRQATYVILLLEEDYSCSANCSAEYTLALGLGKQIVPIFCSPRCSPQLLPPELREAVKMAMYYELDADCFKYLEQPHVPEPPALLTKIVTEIGKTVQHNEVFTQAGSSLMHAMSVMSSDTWTAGMASNPHGNAGAASRLATVEEGMTAEEVKNLVIAELGQGGNLRRKVAEIVQSEVALSGRDGGTTVGESEAVVILKTALERTEAAVQMLESRLHLLEASLPSASASASPIVVMNQAAEPATDAVKPMIEAVEVPVATRVVEFVADVAAGTDVMMETFGFTVAEHDGATLPPVSGVISLKSSATTNMPSASPVVVTNQAAEPAAEPMIEAKSSVDAPVATRVVEFVGDAAGTDVMESFGFTVAEHDGATLLSEISSLKSSATTDNPADTYVERPQRASLPSERHSGASSKSGPLEPSVLSVQPGSAYRAVVDSPHLLEESHTITNAPPPKGTWLCGQLTRDMAVAKLTSAGLRPGTFLIRAKGDPDCYVLSMVRPNNSEALHHQLKRSLDRGWTLTGKALRPPEYGPLEALVARLSISSEGLLPCSLQYPALTLNQDWGF